jgi:hypothetical protein
VDFVWQRMGRRKNPAVPPEKTPAKSAKGIDDPAEIGFNGGIVTRSVPLPADPFLQMRS